MNCDFFQVVRILCINIIALAFLDLQSASADDLASLSAKEIPIVDDSTWGNLQTIRLGVNSVETSINLSEQMGGSEVPFSVILQLPEDGELHGVNVSCACLKPAIVRAEAHPKRFRFSGSMKPKINGASVYGQKVTVVYSKSQSTATENGGEYKEAFSVFCSVRPLFSVVPGKIDLGENEKMAAGVKVEKWKGSKANIQSLHVSGPWIDRCKVSDCFADLELAVPSFEREANSEGVVSISYLDEEGKEQDAKLPFTIVRSVKLAVLAPHVTFTKSSQEGLLAAQVWVRLKDSADIQKINAVVESEERVIESNLLILRQAKTLVFLQLSLKASDVEATAKCKVSFSLGEDVCITKLDCRF